VRRAACWALGGLGLLAVLALAGAPDALAQCVMCKTALTTSSEGRAMVGSFNRAILLMMFAPYAVLAALGAVLFRQPLGRSLRRLLAGAR
jgi:hypothetical protein